MGFRFYVLGFDLNQLKSLLSQGSKNGSQWAVISQSMFAIYGLKKKNPQMRVMRFHHGVGLFYKFLDLLLRYSYTQAHFGQHL